MQNKWEDLIWVESADGKYTINQFKFSMPFVEPKNNGILNGSKPNYYSLVPILPQRPNYFLLLLIKYYLSVWVE